MISRYSKLCRFLLAVCDWFFLNLSCGVIALISHGSYPFFRGNFLLEHWILINFFWLLSCQIQNPYVTKIGLGKMLYSMIKTFLIFIALHTLLFKVLDQSNSFHAKLIFFSFFFFFLFFSRVLVGVFVQVLKKSKRIAEKVVIVGSNKLCTNLASFFSNPDSGFQFIGLFDNDPHDSSYPILGRFEDCIDYVQNNHIQEIYTTLFTLPTEQLRTLIADADHIGVRIRVIPDFDYLMHRKVTFRILNGLPVISFRREPLSSLYNRFRKRLLELFLTLCLFVLFFWWLFPLIMILIKLDSRGPIFFKQKRTGRNNVSFDCYKFRSMVQNNNADTKQASRGDDRITRVGNILRKTNLDELPQFINVFIGNMSIVGPRPHMLAHTKLYESIIRPYNIRHLVKPGITGWAQIHGLRGSLSKEMMENRVAYDVWYMENWTLRLDMKIIFKTIWLTIVGDKTAY